MKTGKQARPWSKKPVNFLCLALLLFPLLSGCWDRLEIEERAAVLGISIDEESPKQAKQEGEVAHLKGKFPKPTPTMLRLTAQIAVPGRIPLGPASAGGGGAEKKPVWVVSVVGHTIDDAMMNLQQQLADQVFLSHLRVIIVSEAVARHGIANINEYLRRNSEVRRAAWLMISKGKAADLMEASPELERVPALYLMATLDHAVALGKFPNDFLGIFWSASSSKGQQPYLPYVQIRSKNNIQVAGMAYFRGDQMVGVTKPLEIGVYMAIKGLNPSGYTAAVPVTGQKGTVMIRALYRKSRMKMDLQNGKPHLHIDVKFELELDEKSNNRFVVDNPNTIRQIEQNFCAGSKKANLDLIRATQEKQSDIFGFGEYARATLPKYWDSQVRTRDKWDTVYQTLPVDVNVSAKIRRVGMMAR